MSTKVTQSNANIYKQIINVIEEADSMEVAVGFPLQKTELFKKGSDENGNETPSIVDIAIWNNFGTSTNTPERNFMDHAVLDIKREFFKDSREALKSILNGTIDIDKFLNIEGAKAAGIVQDSITELREPPNAESTIKRKKSDNPLIDTGKMRQSVTYVVRKKS